MYNSTLILVWLQEASLVQHVIYLFTFFSRAHRVESIVQVCSSHVRANAKFRLTDFEIGDILNWVGIIGHARNARTRTATLTRKSVRVQGGSSMNGSTLPIPHYPLQKLRMLDQRLEGPSQILHLFRYFTE